jgi:N4-gp56 family major capsid protein
VPTVGNSGKYAMIVHPYQAYQLTQDTTWVNGRRDGDLRGKTNPIFEHWISLDVLGIWDGVVVYESPEVPRVAASATDYIAGAVVMGAEAFALGLGQWYKGKFPVQWAEQLADYGNLHGVAVKLCYQSKVLEDSAFVRVYTSCEAPA